MDDLLLSKSSIDGLNTYINRPGQSIALIGNYWLDKAKVANLISAKLLNLPLEKLSSYPFFVEINSKDNKKIGIEEVRKVSSLFNLVVPSKKDISRIVVINEAQLMTAEAQNALLKDLEEPPEGTLFILTTTSLGSLLPTITSRLTAINLSAGSKQTLIDYYKSKGHKTNEIETAYDMSGGQPGLMDLIFSSEDDPMSKATKLAKSMLQGSKLDRLNLVNDLSKDKTELSYFFYMTKEMAKIGVKSKSNASAKRWQKVLAACLKSEDMLNANTQVKLTLTDFVLSIS